MYAIVDIAGQQFRVEKGQKIYVHRLDTEEGKNIDFEEVLLIDNEGKVIIGEPIIKGAYVEGKVLTQVKGDKVIVFKKKRRKGYKIKNGHRQLFSHIEILSINEKGAAKKTVKAEAAPKQEVKKESPAKGKAKPAAKTKTKPVVKTSKPATKVVAEKKTSATKASDTKSKPATKKTMAAKVTAGTKKKTTGKTVASKPASAKKPADKPAVKKTDAKKTPKTGDAKAK